MGIDRATLDAATASASGVRFLSASPENARDGDVWPLVRSWQEPDGSRNGDHGYTVCLGGRPGRVTDSTKLRAVVNALDAALEAAGSNLCVSYCIGSYQCANGPWATAEVTFL